LVDSSHITAVTPASTAGAKDVVITNNDGQTATGVGAFTYYGVPTVALVSPASGPAAGGTSVTITGTGFTSAATVSFGGTPGTGVTFVSDTQITVTSPAKATGGTVDVRVTTIGGTSAISANDRFTYTGVAPTVTLVSPASGSRFGGTSVTITGTGFTSAATVSFGGTPGTGVTFVSNTQITVTSPAHAVGNVDVRVTTVSGTSAISANDRFTYT
jgi:large repetitive protein